MTSPPEVLTPPSDRAVGSHRPVDFWHMAALADEATLLQLVAQYLTREGFSVITATSGDVALDLARSEAPDVCIFDVMLPALDGLSLCRILRKESEVPIILLTARGAEIDRVIGLESGADDYIVKPFSVGEMLARLRAVLRRGHPEPALKLQSGDLTLDLVAHRAFRAGKPLDLAPKGVRVNAINPGVVVTNLHRRSGMAEEQYAKFLERSKETHPLGRAGQPDEIAALILFLASDRSGWITGETIAIDGGRHLTCAR